MKDCMSSFFSPLYVFGSIVGGVVAVITYNIERWIYVALLDYSAPETNAAFIAGMFVFAYIGGVIYHHLEFPCRKVLKFIPSFTIILIGIMIGASAPVYLFIPTGIESLFIIDMLAGIALMVSLAIIAVEHYLQKYNRA